MIFELSKKKFSLVKSLFASHSNNPVIQGVIDGNNPGKIFVDNKSNPTKALLWANTEEDFFLIGDESDKHFNKELNNLLTKKIPQIAKKIGEESLTLILCNEQWIKKLDVILAGQDYSVSTSLMYVLNDAKFLQYKRWRETIPEDCDLRSIDSTLFNKVEDEGGRKFKNWWYSFELFKENGLGYVLLKDNNIVSTCFACFSGGEAVEIGIVTDRNHLRKGYAFFTAAAFLEECINRKIKPIWHTSKRNIPSQRLAEKLGFEKKKESKHYYFLYDEFDNYYDKAIHHAYNEQKYVQAMNYFEKAIKIRKPDRFFYFHYACTLALMGERDEAFSKLYLFLSTLTSELLQYKNFIISNENLEVLRNDIRWEEFIIALEKMETKK